MAKGESNNYIGLSLNHKTLRLGGEVIKLLCNAHPPLNFMTSAWYWGFACQSEFYTNFSKVRKT